MSPIQSKILWPTINRWFIMTVWSHSRNLHRRQRFPQRLLVPLHNHQRKIKKQPKVLHYLIMISVIGRMVPFQHLRAWHQLPLDLHPPFVLLCCQHHDSQHRDCTTFSIWTLPSANQPITFNSPTQSPHRNSSPNPTHSSPNTTLTKATFTTSLPNSIASSTHTFNKKSPWHKNVMS